LISRLGKKPFAVSDEINEYLQLPEIIFDQNPLSLWDEKQKQISNLK
jgi:hypothetical protein